MTASALSVSSGQDVVLAAQESDHSNVLVSQAVNLTAFGPRETSFTFVSQDMGLASVSAGTRNSTPQISQNVVLAAYGEGIPSTASQAAWTFVLDGHRFYVLPLGPEGDWAYDMTTQEWCQLQSQGFPGLNFTHGVMWGLRVIGSDALYTYLYEMDPNQPFDEGWREVKHMVTGGISTRTRSVIGVANLTLTASLGDDSAIDNAISLAFSDDNGKTWSKEFNIPLTDTAGQKVIWNSLGSFSAPGRVFRITDYSGPIRLDGADVVLTVGTGADSGQEFDGQKGYN